MVYNLLFLPVEKIYIYFVWFFCVSDAGCICLHSELSDVHLLGSALLFPGCHAGQSLRSIRVWLRNTRGEAALKMMYCKKGIINSLNAFSAISSSFDLLISSFSIFFLQLCLLLKKHFIDQSCYLSVPPCGYCHLVFPYSICLH